MHFTEILSKGIAPVGGCVTPFASRQERQRTTPTRVPASKFLYEEEGRPLFGDASSQDAHPSVKHLRSPMFEAKLFPEQSALYQGRKEPTRNLPSWICDQWPSS